MRRAAAERIAEQGAEDGSDQGADPRDHEIQHQAERLPDGDRGADHAADRAEQLPADGTGLGLGMHDLTGEDRADGAAEAGGSAVERSTPVDRRKRLQAAALHQLGRHLAGKAADAGVEQLRAIAIQTKRAAKLGGDQGCNGAGPGARQVEAEIVEDAIE